MSNELDKKVRQAIKLLQVASMAAGQPLEICYSGGKDSDVILQLAREAGIGYRAIYKNTTIDPPGTIAHCKANGVEIFKPKMRFLELIKKKGIPTRRARFCCEVLKEYKVLDYNVQGVRRAESTSRQKNYKANEPSKCIYYGSKKNHVEAYYPILNWTDDDVAQFISDRKIQCHPLYYDDNGAFHVERRLGCIGCPLKSDRGLADFKRYPLMAKAWIEAAKVYLDGHPNCSTKNKFGDAYNVFYNDVFCESYEVFVSKTSVTLWGTKPDIRTLMSDYFGVEL